MNKKNLNTKDEYLSHTKIESLKTRDNNEEDSLLWTQWNDSKNNYYC